MDDLKEDKSKDMHTAEESKKTELKDCEFESSHVPVLQLFKPKTQTNDALMQASKSYRPQTERTSDNILPTGMSSRELDDPKDIEQCMDYLVKKSSNPCEENQYLPCLKTKSPEQCVGVKIQHSGDIQVQYATVEKGTRKQITSNGNASKELRMKKMKNSIKYVDILSSCLEEVGRMNDLFTDEVTKILCELTAIRRLTRYASESLNVLADFSECTVICNETERQFAASVNVYGYGVSLLQDLFQLCMNLKDLFVELDNFRLKFINLSQSFSAVDLERFVNNEQIQFLYWIEGVKQVYNKFFDIDAYEILHEQFVAEYAVLKEMLAEFEILINMLGEQVKQKTLTHE